MKVQNDTELRDYHEKSIFWQKDIMPKLLNNIQTQLKKFEESDYATEPYILPPMMYRKIKSDIHKINEKIEKMREVINNFKTIALEAQCYWYLDLFLTLAPLHSFALAHDTSYKHIEFLNKLMKTILDSVPMKTMLLEQFDKIIEEKTKDSVESKISEKCDFNVEYDKEADLKLEKYKNLPMEISILEESKKYLMVNQNKVSEENLEKFSCLIM